MDPLTIGLVSAGVGGLFNMFGSKKRKRYTIQDLINSGYTPYDEEKEITNINRLADTTKKKRRAYTNAKAQSLGLDPVQSSYSREEDIDTGLMTGISEIRKTAAEERNKVASYLFKMNESQEEDDSDFYNFLSGGVQGANIGLKFAELFKDPTGGKN